MLQGFSVDIKSPFKSFNAGKYKAIYEVMGFDKQPKKLPFFRLFVK